MRSGEQPNRLSSAVTLLRAARYSALGTLQRPLCLGVVARVSDLAAVGQCGERLQPTIDPRLLAGSREWLDRLDRQAITRETGIPAVRLATDRHRLGRPLQGPRPAHRNAPELGEDQDAVVE